MAPHRRPVWGVVATAAGLLLVAAAVIGLTRPDAGANRETPRSEVTARQSVAHPDRGNGRAGTGARPAPASTTTTTSAPTANLVPLRIRIPAIGVSSPLIGLGLNPDRTLEVPKDFALAGWYVYRPVPGEPGPSVIAGHVDSRVGPAVFYRLQELRPGSAIAVDRNDGSTAEFTVTGMEQHDKDAFPTERVYGPTAGAELRLITCGGSFDWSTRHYNDNVIVFATLDAVVRS
jgi:sortase (surface protein transpeptidase)